MPVHNVQLDYEQIKQVTAQMNQAVTAVNPQLTQLASSVSDLLQNGLFLQHSSPEMERNYQEFTTQILKLVENINMYAKQFNDIMISMEDMDTKMAAQLRQSGG